MKVSLVTLRSSPYQIVRDVVIISYLHHDDYNIPKLWSLIEAGENGIRKILSRQCYFLQGENFYRIFNILSTLPPSAYSIMPITCIRIALNMGAITDELLEGTPFQLIDPKRSFDKVLKGFSDLNKRDPSDQWFTYLATRDISLSLLIKHSSQLLLTASSSPFLHIFNRNTPGFNVSSLNFNEFIDLIHEYALLNINNEDLVASCMWAFIRLLLNTNRPSSIRELRENEVRLTATRMENQTIIILAIKNVIRVASEVYGVDTFWLKVVRITIPSFPSFKPKWKSEAQESSFPFLLKDYSLLPSVQRLLIEYLFLTKTSLSIIITFVKIQLLSASQLRLANMISQLIRLLPLKTSCHFWSLIFKDFQILNLFISSPPHVIPISIVNEYFPYQYYREYCMRWRVSYHENRWSGLKSESPFHEFMDIILEENVNFLSFPPSHILSTSTPTENVLLTILEQILHPNIQSLAIKITSDSVICSATSSTSDIDSDYYKLALDIIFYLRWHFEYSVLFEGVIHNPFKLNDIRRNLFKHYIGNEA